MSTQQIKSMSNWYKPVTYVYVCSCGYEASMTHESPDQPMPVFLVCPICCSVLVSVVDKDGRKAVQQNIRSWTRRMKKTVAVRHHK